MVYLEYDFTVTPSEPGRDVLVAELAELGFESFVETEEGVKAYIQKVPELSLDLKALFIVEHNAFQVNWKSKEIPPQNWNATWEADFHPIHIDGRCGVRAPFHEPLKVPYDLVIAPKMSFGTGHHETTHLMLQMLLDEDLEDQYVLDMGTGTGVLAILAEKKGAQLIWAVDIDEWSVANAQENIDRNLCKKIQVVKGDAAVLEGEKFDCIIANINRNILVEDLPKYRKVLKDDGCIFLSGFYESDLGVISAACMASNLQLEKKHLKNQWVAAKYVS
ncbi:MAG: 50S ribosomal protein L11 methyltransferase [Bacteroidota bacterium]